MAKVYAWAAGAAVLALVAGSAAFVFLGKPDDKYAQCRGGQVGGGTIGGPFTLTNGDGIEVTDAEVITKPTLVYFGYTFCPDVCPMDNLRNSEAVDILEESGLDVQPVFISVDPARDTPEVMKEYAGMMHPKMIGLTGTTESVKTAADEYKVYYQAQPEVDGFYLVDHTAFTYLMMPGEGFVDFFRREVTADEMASRTSCFVERS